MAIAAALLSEVTESHGGEMEVMVTLLHLFFVFCLCKILVACGFCARHSSLERLKDKYLLCRNSIDLVLS